MKKTLTFLFCFCVAISQAAILRVNNQVGTSAPFSSISDAIDAANPGDTIYVEGSVSSYGSFTVNKELHFVGPGYFLSENTTDTANLLSATLSPSFATGSAGSSFTSLTITSFSANHPNLTFRRCFLNGSVSLNSTNTIITQCYLEATSSNLTVVSNSSNNIISNCYLLFNALSSATTSQLTIDNCVLGFRQVGVMPWNNVTVTNSIFLSGPYQPIELINTTISNCIAQGNQIPAANNTVDWTEPLFVDNGTTDGRFQLADGSLAQNFDPVRGDIGMFAGDAPYVLSGLPPIPRITDLFAPSVASSVSGLTVQIKAVSNN